MIYAPRANLCSQPITSLFSPCHQTGNFDYEPQDLVHSDSWKPAAESKSNPPPSIFRACPSFIYFFDDRLDAPTPFLLPSSVARQKAFSSPLDLVDDTPRCDTSGATRHAPHTHDTSIARSSVSFSIPSRRPSRPRPPSCFLCPFFFFQLLHEKK